VNEATEALLDVVPLEDDWAELSAEVAAMHKTMDAAERNRLEEKAFNARRRADEFDLEAGILEPYDLRVGAEAVERYRQQAWWRRAIRGLRGLPHWVASFQGAGGLDLFGSRVQLSHHRGEVHVIVWTDYTRGRDFYLGAKAAQA
jgi:hypothetical protein